MASYERRGEKWIVRWREDGGSKTRTVPDAATAKRLARDIEQAHALGRRWEPAMQAAIPDLAVIAKNPEHGGEEIVGGLIDDFLTDRRRTLSANTMVQYEVGLAQFAAFLRQRNPRRRLTVDLVTREALVAWWAELVDVRGMSVSTARLRLGAVHRMWAWGYDSDVYGETIARPRPIDMPAALFAPPVAPTWEEMDAFIRVAGERAKAKDDAGALLGPYPVERAWRRKLALVLRFTGLRVDQAMRLRWDDLDLEAAQLTVRPELGKTKAERVGRTVPVSQHLIEHLAGWGVRSGWLIADEKTKRHAQSDLTADIWRASGVRAAAWEGHPHHAFRYGFTSGLKRLGADVEAVEYLVGHAVPGARRAYLDPEAVPLREAVALVPPLSSGVRTLRKAEGGS